MTKNTIYIILLILLPLLAFFLGYSLAKSLSLQKGVIEGEKNVLENKIKEDLLQQLRAAGVIPSPPAEISSFTGKIEGKGENWISVITDLRADDPFRELLALKVKVLISSNTKILKPTELSAEEAKTLAPLLFEKEVPGEVIPPEGIRKEIKLIEGNLSDIQTEEGVEIICDQDIKGKKECNAFSIEIMEQ